MKNATLSITLMIALILGLTSMANAETVKLTGKLVLPKSDSSVKYDLTQAKGMLYSAVKHEATPFPENWKEMDNDQKREWYTKWMQTDDYKAFRDRAMKAQKEQVRKKITVNKKGKFTFDGLKPGQYGLRLSLNKPGDDNPRNPAFTLTTEVTVKDEDVDLGKLSMNKVPQVGDMAPDFETKTVDGKPLKLSDYRGQLVLIDFWAVWCGPCRGETPNLVAVYEQYGARKDFEIIGLSLDKKTDEPIKYAKDHDVKWVNGFLGDWGKDKVTKMYNVSGIPSMWLVGPDGKIIAKGLRGAKTKAAVEKQLAVMDKTESKS